VRNLGDEPYVVERLAASLPLPARAVEVLDLTGRWCRERIPQRHPLPHGAWVREGRHGRTGHDATLVLAVGVTVADVLLGFPVAFFMAKVARRRWRPLLLAAVLTPLWASYLVKAYAWRVMVGTGGVLDWALSPVGLHGPGFGLTAVWLVLAYLWLPYMILPIFAGLDRLPDSLLEASSDLGAHALRTFRSVILPLALPAVVAGSIFTFSLTLGDFVAVNIVGGKTQMLGNVIYANVGAANNLPFAAALACIPVVVMIVYLLAARRAGALESL